jgi:hypothetical protein
MLITPCAQGANDIAVAVAATYLSAMIIGPAAGHVDQAFEIMRKHAALTRP